VIRHANTLQRVANALNSLLNEATLISTFSPEKYVVVFSFQTAHGDVVNVYASVHPVDGRVSIRRSIAKPRSNALTPFLACCGQQCHAVVKHPNDRILSLWFPNYVIHILLFAGGTGNIVMTQDGVVVDALKHVHALKDRELVIPPAGDARQGFYENMAASSPLLAAALETSQTYYVLDVNGIPTFSVIHPPNTTILAQSANMFEAIESAVSLRSARAELEQQRRLHTTDLQRKLAKAEKALTALQKVAQQASKAATLRHEANLLMSAELLHHSGIANIDVVDERGDTRSLALDPRLSILENAIARYGKAKDADRAFAERAARLPMVEREVEELRIRLETAQHATTIEALGGSRKGRVAPAKHVGRDTPPLFRQFTIAAGWTLYVGRNAANNDELTLRFAKPQDWWLHARGVQGSHAVLRCARAGEKPSKAIIESAAAITAWYSSARNSSWVPVAITQKKWVRKPRKAPTGAVTVEREDVVLVQPGLPDVVL
jgi:predicted ribosome quality control (RQC) complex YloA/Tae2 family protein